MNKANTFIAAHRLEGFDIVSTAVQAYKAGRQDVIDELKRRGHLDPDKCSSDDVDQMVIAIIHADVETNSELMEQMSEIERLMSGSLTDETIQRSDQ